VSHTVAVVTGANSGLGFQTALALARTGATVIMACRSEERARGAQAELCAQVPAARTALLPLDVSEPASIREFARRLADEHGRLDVLVNNAGVVGVPLTRNSAGHEMHLATNHLGAFALTGALLPLLRADVGARIVNVGSLGHRLARLDLDDANWERARYSPWQAYFRSKVALLTFTIELDRRLRATRGDVVALAAHPGFAATEVARNSAALAPQSSFAKWLQERIAVLIPSPVDASRPIVHAACDASVRGGDYYGPRGFLEIRGAPARARLNPLVRDPQLGRQVWALSESLTGIRYLSDG